MGNECNNYFLHQSTLTLAPRLKTQVSNAPSNKYALRLKNKFPKLQPIIQQIRSQIRLQGVDEMIRDCPIYFIYQKSAVYQGHWDNGEPHGYGKVLYSDFSYYQGLFNHSQPCTFIDSQHHEDSIYIFPDGTYYRGEFMNSKFQGKGLLVKQNTIKICGYFKQGLPHGQVIQTLLYHNQHGDLVQSTYQGEFVNGIKQGKGRFQDDKLLYVGDFYNGKPHGQGQLIDYNGIEFKGKFYNGKRMTGQLKSNYGIIRGHQPQKSKIQNGYYEWKQGDKFYVGGIKNDKLQGHGRIYLTNGRVIQGIWKKGHNQVVTKVQQITQSQVMQIKKKHQQQFNQVNKDNEMSSRSENISVISVGNGEKGPSEKNFNNQLQLKRSYKDKDFSSKNRDRVMETMN